MKGIVFTEFFEMVEANHGYELVDTIIEDVQPASGGAYTAIASYDHSEIVALVGAYCQRTNTSIPDALRAFGGHLFGVFYKNYQAFFPPNQTAFGFLSSIDNYIHIEVAKLYPDAQLPKFDTWLNEAGDTLTMVYESERKMADLAHGLIETTLRHFNEPAEIGVTPLNEDGSQVQFTITVSR